MKTSGLFLLLLISTFALCASGQTASDSLAAPERLSSVDVRIDLAGPLMNFAGMGYNQYEGGVRLGFRNKYFTCLEAGFGKSDYTGETTGIESKSQSPYYRVGLDYNFTKPNLHNSRFTAGVRYGVSWFKYGLTDSSFADEVWGGHVGLDMRDISGSASWLELVANAETRLWRMIHIGWSIRYKYMLRKSGSEIGDAYYIPGFGKSGKTTFGANFLLIFQIK